MKYLYFPGNIEKSAIKLKDDNGANTGPTIFDVFKGIEKIKNNQRIRPYLEEAIEFLELGLLDEAEETLDEALEIDDKNIKIYNLKAIIKIRTGRVQEALEDLEIVIEMNPHDPLAYFNKGNVLILINPKESIKWFEKSEKLFIETELPISSQFYLAKGQAFKILNEYQEAYDNFNKAIEVDRDNFFAYFRRAELLVIFGDFESVLDDLDSCIKINSEFFPAYMDRAIIFFKLKRYFDARTDLKKLIEINPDFEYEPVVMDLWDKIHTQINYVKSDDE